MKNSTIRAKELRKNMTPQEDILWRQLRNRAWSGLKFRRQQPIDGYIVDFCCFERRLIVEIDGSIHSKTDQVIYDKERDSHLKNQGFEVIRFTNTEIENALPEVLERIKLLLSTPLPSREREVPTNKPSEG